MRLPDLTLLACFAIPIAAIGCGASSDAPGDPMSSDSDFTSQRSPTPDVPRYSDSDAVPDYGGLMRVSLGGAPFTESAATPSIAINQQSTARPYVIGNGTVRVDIGLSPATQIEPGTYSCGEGDAAVMLVERGADSQLLTREAASCTVVIDEVHPAKSARYARVYGRFEAAANAPNGLPSAARGAFAGDFPLPR